MIPICTKYGFVWPFHMPYTWSYALPLKCTQKMVQNDTHILYNTMFGIVWHAHMLHTPYPMGFKCAQTCCRMIPIFCTNTKFGIVWHLSMPHTYSLPHAPPLKCAKNKAQNDSHIVYDTKFGFVWHPHTCHHTPHH